MPDVVDLEPGRELDALVAEKVMGCNVVRFQVEGKPRFGCGCSKNNIGGFPHGGFRSGEPDEELQRYSTDIEAAFEIVALFDCMNLTVTGPVWSCMIGRAPAVAHTAPLAICRAALRAKQK